MAQKTLEETFHATRTTDFNAEFWNKFIGDLGSRIRSLDNIKLDWETVSQQGIQVALDRINEVLGPAAERVQNIAALGFLTVESASSRTLALGTVNFVAVQGDQLALFVPTPFVAVTRKSNPLDFAIGQVTFFDRATGSMDIQISYLEGDPGPHNDWIISAVAGQALAQSSLLRQTVAARDVAVEAKESAAGLASAANISAGNAAGSATAANTHAGNAAGSATAANTYAGNAEGSATLAGKYANNDENVEVVAGTGLYSTKHYLAKVQALWNSVVAGLAAAVHAATAKTTIADIDEFGVSDSAASWALKKVTALSLRLYTLVNPYVTLASAATSCDIGAAQSKNVTITGTTTITAFPVAPAGTERWLKFAASLTLTYNAASMILPGLANITVAAGDKIKAVSLGAGNWELSQYEAAAVPVVPVLTKSYNGAVINSSVGGLLSWSHTLGTRAKYAEVYVKFLTAVGGWSIGDECPITAYYQGTAQVGAQVVQNDATTFAIRCGAHATIALSHHNKTTGVVYNVSHTDIQYGVRLYA